jgi:predicted aconitase with swiveling domain
MRMTGRVINQGRATGQAVVLDVPFSFIGDFDPDTGRLLMQGHPLEGQELAGKVLVIPNGKGGTIAPFIAYAAKKKGNAPAAILCDRIEPITCESAITIDIPLLVSSGENFTSAIRTGQLVAIDGAEINIGP